jgi:hypothetical protein
MDTSFLAESYGYKSSQSENVVDRASLLLSLLLLLRDRLGLGDLPPQCWLCRCCGVTILFTLSPISGASVMTNGADVIASLVGGIWGLMTSEPRTSSR